MFLIFSIMAALFFVCGLMLIAGDPLDTESRAYRVAGWSWVAALICLGGCLVDLV